jgi:hypothetical protein
MGGFLPAGSKQFEKIFFSGGEELKFGFEELDGFMQLIIDGPGGKAGLAADFFVWEAFVVSEPNKLALTGRQLRDSEGYMLLQVGFFFAADEQGLGRGLEIARLVGQMVNGDEESLVEIREPGQLSGKRSINIGPGGGYFTEGFPFFPKVGKGLIDGVLDPFKVMGTLSPECQQLWVTKPVQLTECLVITRCKRIP